MLLIATLFLPALACNQPQSSKINQETQVAIWVAQTSTSQAAAVTATFTPAPTATITTTPTVTPTPLPTTVAIQKDGNGDFATLAEAVAAVPPGSTIILGQGEFWIEGPLAFNKPITLQGAGFEQTTVRSASGENIILYSGPGKLKLVGITFHFSGVDTHNVVSINNAEIEIENWRGTG